MKHFATLLLLILSINSSARIIVSGYVKNKNGDELPGVNIYIKNTYDGCSSNTDGSFSFNTSEEGIQVVVASYIGYQKSEIEIDLNQPKTIEFVLKESLNTLDAVTITAGTFAAADEKTASVLEPLDIYTTASANGDVMAAIRTMPGAQASPDDGRLMVRGGNAYESKTYIDGLVSSKPYYTKTPDIAARGRFSPSLFSGVMFNTGGYSAEYGQALSSILVLNSTDVAASDVYGISLMTIGTEASLTKAKPKSSIMASGGYTNMGVYQKLLPSKLNWTKPVESINLNSAFRYKPGSSSLLKAFVNADFGRMAYETTEGDGSLFAFENNSKNIYSNVSYRDCLSENTCYKIGLSSTYDSDQMLVNENEIETTDISAETRASLTHIVSEGINLNVGISETFHQYKQSISQIGSEFLFNPQLDDHLLGVFCESEIKFNKHLAIRPGVRAEYSSILNEINVAPRFALALKTGKISQLSAAWGKYYQTPEMDYLKFNSNLQSENSTHYIMSYQAGNVTKRLFRSELYYKTYNKLITWEGQNEHQPQNLSNSGSGYAQGIDLFWRDKKSIKHFEYWVTYSFIDTKRMYQNYTEQAQPDFISDHTFSVVTKFWANKISTQFGSSLTIASPRNYDNPSTPLFMDGKTEWYNNLSLNMSHIFFIGDQYSVFYVSLSNVLGNDNILGYRPSTVANAEGNFALTPIQKDTKRFLFFGIFLSF